MKLTKILTPLLVGACLLATTNEAMAQKRGARIGKIFQKLDTNKDGKITEAEAGKAWARLSKADANKDGAVTKAELAALRGKRKKGGKKRKKTAS